MKYNIETLRPKLDQFLAPLLQHAGFDVKYELRSPENPHPEVENPEVTVVFSGPDVELLLANRAELLLALEHLSMEAMRLPAEDHSLISFDANDYRLLRMEELRMSALAAAEKVKRTRVPFHFNPMTSRERRVIHLALREEKDLRSESLGVGPARAVVIVPADMPTPPAPPVPPRRPEGGPRPNGGGFRGDRRGPGGGGGRDRFRGGGNRGPRRDRDRGPR
ncbi:MAG TPA: R3H domain-containing nucleic acid-binding protein [Bryobacteraceae bacterium]|jgi:spoIIIJ-associated protein|nr:R3H domain-containing nucleic acid-binding protein [Bryobacteraceae bacterium]